MTWCGGFYQKPVWRRIEQITRIEIRVIREILRLKDVFQSELKDARIHCRADLTERIAVQGGGITRPDSATDRWRAGDTHRPETIRQVESLSTDFDPLHFPNSECSG